MKNSKENCVSFSEPRAAVLLEKAKNPAAVWTLKILKHQMGGDAF
jgi:hypothetical protein